MRGGDVCDVHIRTTKSFTERGQKAANELGIEFEYLMRVLLENGILNTVMDQKKNPTELRVFTQCEWTEYVVQCLDLKSKGMLQPDGSVVPPVGAVIH